MKHTQQIPVVSLMLFGLMAPASGTAYGQSYMDRLSSPSEPTGAEIEIGASQVTEKAAQKPAPSPASSAKKRPKKASNKKAAVAAHRAAKPMATLESIEALHLEVNALRIDIEYLAQAQEATARAISPPQEMKRIPASSDDTQHQIDLVSKAIEAGLDPSLAAPLIQELKDRQVTKIASANQAQSTLNMTTTQGGTDYGLSLNVTTETAYVFRGYNVFQGTGQGDQFAYVAPSISWNIGDTGAYVGYWGAYQLTGNNREQMIESGLGAEQDLYVGYGFTGLPESMGASLSATYYFYPMATTDSAGVTNPSYLEPALNIAHSGAVDSTFAATYMHGVQAALSGGRYIYLNPSICKSIDMGDGSSLSMGVGAGLKSFIHSGPKAPDNSLDLRADWAWEKTLKDALSITPAIHAAWTNFANVDLGDEYIVWFGLSAGKSI